MSKNEEEIKKEAMEKEATEKEAIKVAKMGAEIAAHAALAGHPLEAVAAETVIELAADPDIAQKAINVIAPKPTPSQESNTGKFTSSTNPQDWKFEIGGFPQHNPAREAKLSTTEKQNIIKQINEIDQRAYESLAKKHGLQYTSTTRDGNITHHLTNKDGSPISVENHQKLQTEFTDAFNTAAKSVNPAISMKLVGTPPKPGEQIIKMANPMASSPTPSATAEKTNEEGNSNSMALRRS